MTSLNLTLQLRRLESPELIRDYYEASPRLAPFFAGFPWDAAAARRIADNVHQQFDADALRAMQPAIEATTDSARARLERIANGEGFFVTTGQQAGLFSGPLFTVYKTLSAIRLAQTLETTLGVPVAPLFWIAADDHDFGEVNHTYVIGADNDLRRIEVAAADSIQHSMQRHVLGEEILTAVDALAATLPQGEAAQQLLDWMRACYAPGQSMASAFAGLLHRFFAHHDLLITSSAHPVVKALGARVVRNELNHAEQHEKRIRAQTDRLIAAGYHEQVTIRPGAVNVLYEDDSGRDRLVREDGQWALSRSKRTIENSELDRLLSDHPDRFSPNVHLRPVVASAVFPTLAYVGGPAEVSYFAQIGCLFDAHAVQMPLIYPRASLEIIEHKTQKIIDKFSLRLEDIHQPFDKLASQVIRDELPAAVTQTVSALREEIAASYAQLVETTQSIDPTLKGPLENARNSSHKALADVEKKIVSHLKKKNEIGIEQLRKASVSLYPNGQPQERVISAASYIARYGLEFIDAIAAELEVHLGTAAPEWQGVVCD